MTAAGARLLAQRLAAPLTDPAAIARRLDAVDAVRRRRGAARATCATRLAAAPDLARALARLVRRPRRPARSRGDPRRPRGGGRARGAARRARRAAGRDRAAAAPRSRRPTPRSRPSSRAALADELPLFKRDGGFVRAGYDAALDEARALRDESRARRRGAAGALRRRDRRPRAQDPPQQRARLFRRGDGAARREAAGAAAQRDLHPPPDAGRPGALHHHRARRARGQDRQRRRPRARASSSRSSSGWPPRSLAQPSRIKARRRGAGRARRRGRRSPRSRSSATTCGPQVDGSLDFVIEGGRHPVVEQALAARRRAVRRQ